MACVCGVSRLKRVGAVAWERCRRWPSAGRWGTERRVAAARGTKVHAQRGLSVCGGGGAPGGCVVP